MLRFEHPYYLYALGLLPFFLLLLWWVRANRAKKIRRIGDRELVLKLLPSFDESKLTWKSTLWLLAYTSLIIGIANPQMGSRIEKVKHKGSDIVVAIDVSRSMNATDIAPSRMERTKQVVKNLMEALPEERYGIVIFAGQAYIQMPITTDIAGAKLYIDNLSTDILSAQGTSIGNAIDVSMSAFPEKAPKNNRAIVIISDGEEQDETALEAAQQAHDNGVIMHSVGIGSSNGAPIPNEKGNQAAGFKQDGEGHTVISRLNEKVLGEVARIGGGKYVHLENSKEGLKPIVEQLSKMEDRVLDEKQFTAYESYFMHFLIISFVLLLLEGLFFETPSKWWTHSKRWLSWSIVLIACCTNKSEAQLLDTKPALKQLRQANEWVKAKQFTRADSLYKKILKRDSSNAIAHYNLAWSLYEQQQFDNAQFHFESAAHYSTDSLVKAKAYFNAGNCKMEEREYQRAIQYFRKALKLNPADADFRYNLSYAKAMLEAEKKRKGNNSSNKPKQEQKKTAPNIASLKQQLEALLKEDKFEEALQLLEAAEQKQGDIGELKEYKQRLKDIIEIEQ